MTASARPEAVIVTLTTATREKVGLEQVEKLGKETPRDNRLCLEDHKDEEEYRST